MIFLLTDKRVVYRSGDEGKTWTNEMNKFNQLIDANREVGKSAVNRVLSGVKAVLLSSADPNRVRARAPRRRQRRRLRAAPCACTLLCPAAAR